MDLFSSAPDLEQAQSQGYLCQAAQPLVGGAEDPAADVTVVPNLRVGPILPSLHPTPFPPAQMDSPRAIAVEVLAGRSTHLEFCLLMWPQSLCSLLARCQKSALWHMYSTRRWHWASSNGSADQRIGLTVTRATYLTPALTSTTLQLQA